MDPRPYLDYLDKEMAIMGLLSAFCVAVAALTVQQVAGADDGGLKFLWDHEQSQLELGLGSLIVGALFFYRQRSHLAWLYGQLCLLQSKDAPPGALEAKMDEADAWLSWTYYRTGFVAVSLAFAQIGIALFHSPTHAEPGTLHPPGYFWLLPALAILFAVLQWHIMHRYKGDHPWSEWGTELSAPFTGIVKRFHASLTRRCNGC